MTEEKVEDVVEETKLDQPSDFVDQTELTGKEVEDVVEETKLDQPSKVVDHIE